MEFITKKWLDKAFSKEFTKKLKRVLRPKYVYVVTEQWGEETEISGIFAHKASAEKRKTKLLREYAEDEDQTFEIEVNRMKLLGLEKLNQN